VTNPDDGYLVRLVLFGLLPGAAIWSLHYWAALPWWLSVPVGLVSYFALLICVFVLIGNREDRELRRRGLPMLDDRWPDDF
jgi:hypothetical protein